MSKRNLSKMTDANGMLTVGVTTDGAVAIGSVAVAPLRDMSMLDDEHAIYPKEIGEYVVARWMSKGDHAIMRRRHAVCLDVEIVAPL